VANKINDLLLSRFGNYLIEKIIETKIDIFAVERSLIEMTILIEKNFLVSD
jgi:hypothetical protein